MLTQSPRGTQDIYGKQAEIWLAVENKIREVCRRFGMGEIRTPVIEHTELFLRGVGETSDIVQKEMYTFMDKGGRSISLRPEITAGAARAYVERSMQSQPQPTKMYYIGPNFRYEKPQAGRWRQHHQFGAELYGSYHAAADAEIISLGHEVLTGLGIKGAMLHINNIGGPECRTTYNRTLKAFIHDNLENLCPTCKERYEKNPLRVLDCKESKCREIIRNAPSVLDALGTECRAHLDRLTMLLDTMGIPFILDDKLVRGLDYYTRTVFEFIFDIGTGGKKTEIAVCAGGRYDNLIEECGGPQTGAVGFGMGIERLLLALERSDIDMSPPAGRGIYIGCAGEEGFIKSQALVYRLRRNGIDAESDIIGRSVKAQMKYADKLHAAYSVIIGDDEIANNRAAVKNMATGERIEIGLDEIESLFAHREEMTE